MQTVRKNVGFLVKVICGFLFAFLVLALICVYAFSMEYGNCDEYTEKLKGGVHEFKGKKYTIKLCGANTLNSSEKIRMQVLNEVGEVLALRYFTIRTNFVGPRELEYAPNFIIYHDYSQDEVLSILDMPPTRMDWLRAKVPFVN